MRLPLSLLATSVAAAVGQSVAIAQTPQVVTDINQISTVASSFPWGGNGAGPDRNTSTGRFKTVGPFNYFRASSTAHGTELYRSLGMPRSTTRLTDINPGAGSSSPNYLSALGAKLFFAASGPSGNELYVLDTTAAKLTAKLVKDINPGPGGSSPRYMTAYNGFVYFQAWNATSGTELWRSDGTTANTTMLMDIWSGSSSSRPDFFTVYKNKLYFAANDGTSGTEFWRTDGTAKGTVRVADIRSGSSGSFPRFMVLFKSDLYFRANDGVAGTELWKYDGTTASLVHDVRTGSSSSSPANLKLYKGALYFTAGTPSSGTELCRTDGKTLTIFDLNVGRTSSTPSELELVGSGTGQKLAMRAFRTGSGSELVFHDGTTSTFIDVFAGRSSSTPSALLGNSAGTLFFRAKGAATGGTELWSSDGTATGTKLLMDINKTSKTASSIPKYLTAISLGGFLFAADDGVNGTELWVSNGTAAGTKLLADLNTVRTTGGSFPTQLVDAHGTLYFAANDGKVGTELWKSDGTVAGTKLVNDLRTGSKSGSPSNLLVIGKKLFFTSNATRTTAGGLLLPHGNELISLDLTNDKVTIIDVRTGSSGSFPTFLTAYKGQCYFRATDSTSGAELWRSDGTVAGTKMVKDIRPGAASSSPHHLAVHKGLLYFGANDGTNGSELWVSDGSARGTRQLVDIRPGAAGSSPNFLTSVGDKLMFRANGPSGTELWLSDGTVAGTKSFDIRPGTSGSFPFPARSKDGLDAFRTFLKVDGKVYFSANNGTNGTEVHVYDGTKVVMAKDVRAGSTSSSPAQISALGKRVLFRASDGTSGSELWISDGTATGTVQVKDIEAGARSSIPFGIVPIGSGRALFAAQTAANGTELWITDGTATGTKLLADINPMSLSSGAENFTLVNGQVFFTARHATFNKELFKIDINGMVQRSGQGCSASGAIPILDATDPVIAKTMTLSVRDAVQSKPGMAVIGLRATAGKVSSFSDCTVYLDITAPLLVIPFVTDASGSWSVNLSLPNSPALVGQVFALQAAVGPTSTIVGFDLSNLLLLDVGK